MPSDDLDKLLQRAQEVSEQMAAMRDRLLDTEVVGNSIDGSVAVTMTMNAEFRDVRVGREVVERANQEEIESLVLEALKDAGAQLRQMTEQRMSEATGRLSDFTGA